MNKEQAVYNVLMLVNSAKNLKELINEDPLSMDSIKSNLLWAEDKIEMIKKSLGIEEEST